MMTRDSILVDGSFVPRARADVASVALDGEAVIHDHGRIHVLDPTATLVWRCCDGDASVIEIAAELADVFSTPPDQVRADVEVAISRLAELGLFVDTTGTAAAADEAARLDPEVLVDPPGSCAGCAEHTWALRATFAVGSRLAAVGTDSARAGAAMRSAFRAFRADPTMQLDAEPPFLAVELHDRAAGR